MRKSISHTLIENQFPKLARKILTRHENISVKLFHTKRMKNKFFRKEPSTFLHKSITQTIPLGVTRQMIYSIGSVAFFYPLKTMDGHCHVFDAIHLYQKVFVIYNDQFDARPI